MTNTVFDFSGILWEATSKKGTVKFNRTCVFQQNFGKEPKVDRIVTFTSNGFFYKGVVVHKTITHIYIKEIK